MTKSPLVTVVMPAFNAAPFLSTALESVLSQTYRNLEIICINDGSTDSTLEILNRYSEADSRIRVVSHGTNSGQIRAMNEGFDLANGELVALMDADDISYPTRVERQVAAFAANPDVMLCGMNVDYLLFQNHILRGQNKRSANDQIRIINIFDVFFCQPTVMYNNRILQAGHLRYDPKFAYGEDFEFISRVSFDHPVMHLNEVGLIFRRQQHKNVSMVFRTEQLDCTFRVVARQLRRFGFTGNIDPLLRLANLNRDFNRDESEEFSDALAQIWSFSAFSGDMRAAYESGFALFTNNLIEACQRSGNIRSGIRIMKNAGLGSQIKLKYRGAAQAAVVFGDRLSCDLMLKSQRLWQRLRSVPLATG